MQHIPYIIHSCRDRLLNHVTAGDRLASKRVNAIDAIRNARRYRNQKQQDSQIHHGLPVLRTF